MSVESSGNLPEQAATSERSPVRTLLAGDRQVRAHVFLMGAVAGDRRFTVEEFASASGWTVSTARTHWSKHLRGIIEDDGVLMRVIPGRLPDEKGFKQLLSQVRNSQPTFVAAGYELVEEIGRGGFGVVFRAKRTFDGRAVALKFPMEVAGESRERLKRFFREQRLQTPMRHDHVAEVFDYNLQPLWISMELAESTLRPIIGHGGCMELFLQALSGLQYIHDRKVIHRDFVPENILVFGPNPGWTAKVADFGLAVECTRSTTVITQITPGPRTFGHSGYISPEQRYDPGSVDTRTDIYSAGIVLGEILTGESGFSPVDIDLVNERYRDVVKKCLKRNPNDRYQSVSGLRSELTAILESQI